MDYKLPTWLLVALRSSSFFRTGRHKFWPTTGVFKMPIALRLLLHFGYYGCLCGAVGGGLSFLMRRKNHMTLYGIVAGLIIRASMLLH